MNNIQTIHETGTVAAKKAVSDYLAEWTAKTGGNQYGEPMYCGFAWVEVEVTRTNSKQAKELASVGFKKSYLPKTLQLWDPANHCGQSMDCKEQGAKAYANVLQQNGIAAYASSRAD